MSFPYSHLGPHHFQSALFVCSTIMIFFPSPSQARSEAVSEYIAPDGKTVARMPEHVRKQMIRMLKRRWDEVNKEYQLLNLSLFNLDTVHKVK